MHSPTNSLISTGYQRIYLSYCHCIYCTSNRFFVIELFRWRSSANAHFLSSAQINILYKKRSTQFQLWPTLAFILFSFRHISHSSISGNVVLFVDIFSLLFIPAAKKFTLTSTIFYLRSSFVINNLKTLICFYFHKVFFYQTMHNSIRGQNQTEKIK